jgi:hypothetical protein
LRRFWFFLSFRRTCIVMSSWTTHSSPNLSFLWGVMRGCRFRSGSS